MPGWGEGFGIVYLEAMACGVPTVGSVLDGSRDALMGGRLGMLVNPHDAADLERGLFAALSAPRGVPEGLHYFANHRFLKRVVHVLDRIGCGPPPLLPTTSRSTRGE